SHIMETVCSGNCCKGTEALSRIPLQLHRLLSTCNKGSDDVGLFINHNEHPKVFKNNGKILEPNQGYFHKDNFADMIHEQKEINQSLTNAFHEIKIGRASCRGRMEILMMVESEKNRDER